MKICKIIGKIFQTKPIENVEKATSPCPVVYNRNNVTSEEFKKFVHWLATNKINKTFYEPDKFVTQAERKAQEKRQVKLEEYRKFVQYLAKNNIDKTFYC